MDFLLEGESAITQINAELDYCEDVTVERMMLLYAGDLDSKCESVLWVWRGGERMNYEQRVGGSLEGRGRTEVCIGGGYKTR